MFLKRWSFLVFVLSLWIFMGAQGKAKDKTIRTLVHNFQSVPVSYGVNQLQVGSQEFLIMRALFETEGTAWGGDVYTVLLQDGPLWKMVRHEKDSLESVLTKTIPHTYEDSVRSVRFMLDKEKEKLYLVEASRDYNPEQTSTLVSFTLFELQTLKDFNIPVFHQLAKETTSASYCNVDLGMFKELGIALPKDGRDYLACSIADPT